MDQRIRKIMSMHKALHPRDAVDRLYMSRKEEKDDLPDIVYTSIQRLEDYIEKRGGRLVTTTRNNTNNTSITTIIRKQKWEEKKLYGPLR